ncbi:MAG TPA: flagellar basal-body rod protein FlgG [bacterium]|jgi:flagellar basal-body rod protein FlgG|nr:flagellar basal-body rod protein FlgG [bacterium]
MMQSLYTAATGMAAQQLNIDTISNNLANVSTTGFKKQRLDFQDLLYVNLKPSGTPTSPETNTPIGIEIGEGVKPVATQRIFTEGAVQNTNNPLDLLIAGNESFFQVTLPNGQIAYTRDGSFTQDGNGNIVTANGYFMDPPVQIPADTSAVQITSTGQIMATIAGSNTATQIGQIELARFVNPAGLTDIGNNLYQQTPASGDPIVGTPSSTGFSSVQQGSLEASNVDTVSEMVNLIVAQRAYELNSKAVSTADTMLSDIANMKQFP